MIAIGSEGRDREILIDLYESDKEYYSGPKAFILGGIQIVMNTKDHRMDYTAAYKLQKLLIEAINLAHVEP